MAVVFVSISAEPPVGVNENVRSNAVGTKTEAVASNAAKQGARPVG